MTVAQLIQKLQAYDQSLPVCTDNCGGENDVYTGDVDPGLVYLKDEEDGHSLAHMYGPNEPGTYLAVCLDI